MVQEVTRAEANAADAIELWFFRELSDEQRGGLIYLVLGDKIASEAKNHGLQRLCLGRIIRQIREAALATADADIAALRGEVERYREVLAQIAYEGPLDPSFLAHVCLRDTSAALTDGARDA